MKKYDVSPLRGFIFYYPYPPFARHTVTSPQGGLARTCPPDRTQIEQTLSRKRYVQL
jgi:hypothetical protein